MKAIGCLLLCMTPYDTISPMFSGMDSNVSSHASPFQNLAHDFRIFHSVAFALTSVTSVTSVTSTKTVLYGLDCLDSRPTRKDRQTGANTLICHAASWNDALDTVRSSAHHITAPISHDMAWLSTMSHGILVVASSSRITSERITSRISCGSTL